MAAVDQNRPNESSPATFYSALLHTASDLRLIADKAGLVKPDQALHWLSARQREGKFKAEELNWSGLSDWLALQPGKVAVINIENFLRDYGVRVGEVIKGGPDAATQRQRQSEKVDAIARELFGEMRRTGNRLTINGVEYFDDELGYALLDGDVKPEQLPAAMQQPAANWIREYPQYQNFIPEPVDPTRYEKHTLEGGENYRELLITLPYTPPREMVERAQALDAQLEAMRAQAQQRVRAVRFHTEYLSEDESVRYEKLLGELNALDQEVARQEKLHQSTHWSEGNVVVHARFNERTDIDGRKVLMVEELQSDWAQQGKRAGFVDTALKRRLHGEEERLRQACETEFDRLRDVVRADIVKDHTDEGVSEERARVIAERMVKRMTYYDVTNYLQNLGGAHLRTLEQLQNDYANVQREIDASLKDKVEPGPFVTDTKAWVALGVKRLIRYAAENNVDAVAFISGQQSADRYDMSQQVRTIEWHTRQVSAKGTLSAPPTEGRLIATDHNGRRVLDRQMPASELADHIGKDLAERIVSRPVGDRTPYGDEVRYLTGLELKIGGEGMKAFYDQLVPQIANEVLRKLGGGKLGPVAVRQPGAGATTVRNGVTFTDTSDPLIQLGFDMTPALRQQALAGLPLFSERPLAGGSSTPVFYSALARTAEAMAKQDDKQGMIQPQQAKQWLQARQKEGKFKAEELQWSGVEEWLDAQDGKVAVSAIAAFLNANGVQVIEIVKGETGLDAEPSYVDEANDFGDEFAVFDEEGRILGGTYPTRDQAEDALVAMRNDQPTKYGQYTLPGGENYREMLLTLPNETTGKLESLADDIDREYRRHGNSDRYATLLDQQRALRATQTASQFKSAHWDEPNVIAHLRINDRVDLDGKRVLFIEEVQSDWAQQGKRHGFKQPVDGGGATALADFTQENRQRVRDLLAQEHLKAGLPEERAGPQADATLRTWSDYDVAEYLGVQERFKELEDQADLSRDALPAAPFVTDTKSWLSLAVKRMIRYGAEHGYDRIAFINGEQSGNRYDLSRQVEQIRYIKQKDGRYTVWAANENGGSIKDELDQSNLTQQDIERFVGKDIAQRIVDGVGREQDGDMILDGVNLKVGGEGMKAFYDNIVPQTVNDVLKKLGGGTTSAIKVVTFDKDEADRMIASGEIASYADMADYNEAGQIGFDITPELRERALSGLPLFSSQNDGANAGAAPSWTGMPVEDIELGLAALRQKWEGFTAIHVVQKAEDVGFLTGDRIRAGARTEGVYDPRSGSVFLIADNLDSVQRAVWVAAHEVVGHGGLRMLQDVDVNEALAYAAANPFVAELARAIRRDRQLATDQVAVEEALAELQAAILTDDFDHIRTRYGIQVPQALRVQAGAAVDQVGAAVKGFLADAGSEAPEQVSDASVRALLDAAADCALRPNRAAFPAAEAAEPVLYSQRQQSFHSALLRTLEELPKIAAKDGTVRPEQALQWLAARQKEGKFKAEELEWSGLPLFLSDVRGRMSVEEILHYASTTTPSVVVAIKEKDPDAEARERDAWVEQQLQELEDEFDDAREQKIAEFASELSGSHYVEEDENEDGEPVWLVRAWRQAGGEQFDNEADAQDACERYNASEIDDALTEFKNNLPEFDEDEHRERLEREWEREVRDDSRDPQFGKYALAGADGYREMLLLLTSDPYSHRGIVRFDTPEQVDAFVARLQPPTLAALHRHVLTDGLTVRLSGIIDVKEAQAAAQACGGRHQFVRAGIAPFKSKHWDENKVVAHVRMTDHTDNAGDKVLVIEELQSDWAGAGRRIGFLPSPLDLAARDEEEARLMSRLTTMRDAMTAATGMSNLQALSVLDETNPEYRRISARLEELCEAQEPRPGYLPDLVAAGPFVRDTRAWLTLALRHALDYAASYGYDKIAFTTGQQNVDRFSLHRQIDEIRYFQKEDGRFDLAVKPLNSFRPVYSIDGRSLSNLSTDDVEQLVGKEIAAKMVRAEGEVCADKFRSLKGDGLTVGGDAMLAFYDQIVPQIANDLLRKLGGDRIGIIELPRETADAPPRLQPGVAITPGLRRKVLSGQPLFSERPAITREEALITHPELQQARDYLDSLAQTARHVRPR